MNYDNIKKEVCELEEEIKRIRVNFIKERFPAYKECTDEDCLSMYVCISIAYDVKLRKEKGLM